MPTQAEENPVNVVVLADFRLLISVLLVGGLILVVMGQAIYKTVLPHNRWLVILLMLIGLGSFGLAAHLTARQQPSKWPRKPVRNATRFLGVSAGQLALLLFAPCFSLMAALAAGEKLEAHSFPISLIAWTIAIAAVLFGGYRKGGSDLYQVKRYDIWISIGLFLIALILRAINIDSMPSTLSGDEGSAGLVATRFLNGQADNLFTVGWFSFPSLYFAVQSLGILALGQTAAGLRITSAFAGSLTVVAVYWLGRTLFNRTTAVMAAFFLAAFHYHIHFSRLGVNNIWDGLFIAVVLVTLWHGWKSGQRVSFLISGFALGFGLYFYVSFRVLPLLLFVWAGMAYLLDRQTFKRRFADLILVVVVAFVVVLPLLFFYQQHPSEFNAPLQRVSIFNGWLDQAVASEGKPAVFVVWDQIARSALGFTHLPLRHWYNPGVPLLLAGGASLFILGILWSLIQFNLISVMLLLPLIAVIVAGGLSQDAPASQRYIIATPIVAILIALPLAQTASWLQSVWPGYRRLFVGGLALVMMLIIISNLRYYFFDVYDHYVLGGFNTEVATAVAHYLDEQDPEGEAYFFGFPRMGYYSLSTVPYLVPDVKANDILDPLTANPDWQLSNPTTFIFLPEREGESQFVEDAYPRGVKRHVRNEEGTLLFIAYEATGP
jgi:4-amino-4-deoxy-L-arabinose transferase-like glycosyltransferase